MPTEQRDFEPLLISIEKVLNAIERQMEPLAEDVQELRSLYDDYALCCCRRAHVIKDPNLA
jgi:hypothetical protein